MSTTQEKELSTETSEKNDITNDVVVTKYKMVGEIVNRVLKQVVDKCQPDASVIEICEFGDAQLNEETGKVFKKEKDVKKGIAFPTCLSINNCVGHFSPLKSDKDVLLKSGDLVKIDLGAHIDGFMGLAAHTIVVGASSENKIKGRVADVLLAAHYASEIALRLIQPGLENNAVTDAVTKVAEEFNCKPIIGMLSHEMKQYQLEGGKTIIQNPTDAQRKEHEKAEFAVNEVYEVDVSVTTGEGKPRELDAKTTIYRKTDEVYLLKMKASRALFSDIEKKFGNMPFTLRSLENEQKARLGVAECVKHRLLEPYNVLYDKEGELVAQFKFTVLLMPSGSHKITGLPFDTSLVESEHSIKDEQLKQVLAKSVKISAAKKKKANKAKQASGGDKAEGVDKSATKENQDANVKKDAKK